MQKDLAEVLPFCQVPSRRARQLKKLPKPNQTKPNQIIMNLTQAEIDALYSDNDAPIPAGDYAAVITAATPKVSENSGLTYCLIQTTVTEGEHAGRIVDNIINFNNPHSFCVGSTKKTKTQLYLATGLTLDFASPLALIGKAVTLGVKIKKAKADDQYGDKNEVRYYKPPVAPAVPAALPQATPQQEPQQERQWRKQNTQQFDPPQPTDNPFLNQQQAG